MTVAALSPSPHDVAEAAAPGASVAVEQWRPLAELLDDGFGGGRLASGADPRRFIFRPLTGSVELALAEAGASGPWPRRVSAALAAVLETVGGEAVTLDEVEALTVGDRQLLARALDCWLGHNERWFTAPCSACGDSFDFSLELAALPVKEAAASFPMARVEMSWGEVKLRVPTGVDQLAMCTAPLVEAPEVADAGEDSSLRLLRRLVTADGGKDRGETLSWERLRQLAPHAEAALEAAAPAVAEVAAASCPHCAATVAVSIDPYLALETSAERLLDEIHRLALSYGWSEEAILALPRHRRLAYLTRLDRARGMRS